MKLRLTYLLSISVAAVTIASGQDSLARGGANAITTIRQDTILTTELRIWSNPGGLNDSLLDIAWYRNVSKILGIYHGQDTVNYYSGGSFDKETGQVHLGQKYPYYSSDPVRLVYQYVFDTVKTIVSWYGGVDLAMGLGTCKFGELNYSNRDLTPPVTFLEGDFAFGKKNYFLSLGLSICGDGVGEAKSNDTIQIGTQKISPPRMWLSQVPLIAHYRCDPATWVSVTPEAGIAYVGMKRNVLGYSTTTNMATVNIEDNISRICPKFGGTLSLSIPSFFGAREVLGNRLVMEGSYDRLLLEQGMDIYRVSVGVSDEEALPRGKRSGWGLFYRAYQSSKLQVKQLGVFITGFFQM